MCMKVILWENLIANEGEECLIDNSNGFIAYTDIEKALDDIVYNLYDIGTSIYSILNSQNIDIEEAKEKGGVTYFIKGICYVVLYENGKYTLYKNAKSLFSGDILEIYKEIEKTAA